MIWHVFRPMVRPVIRKVDDNQREIVACFRRLGWSVVILSTIGKGCPDLAVGKHGWTTLVEIKDGSKIPSKRKLTPDEEEFHANWRGSIIIVESVADVIELDRKRSRGHG